MLDVALRDLSAQSIRSITITFEKSTHTAIIGPPASGASTLLRLIAGELRAESGSIAIGARDVTKLGAGKRPILYATSAIDAPARWSVRHVLVAAVRQRSLDRVDRQREFDLAASKWKIDAILDRRIGTLSSSERTLTNLARIELLKPAILIADRVLEHGAAADDYYRTLRVLGTTVISAPSSVDELGFTDRVVVLDAGQIVQDGTFTHVYRHPATRAAATASGDVNLIPVTIHGRTVESPIGSWEIDGEVPAGARVAAVRPEHFTVASRGEESDLIFGIEEASFHGTHWRATGILSNAMSLRVALPAETDVHKGKLLALRYDPSRITLLPS